MKLRWLLPLILAIPCLAQTPSAVTCGNPQQPYYAYNNHFYLCSNGTPTQVDTAAVVLSIQASGSPLSVPATSGIYWNNTASAYSFNLPVPVAGLQLCFGDYKARTSAVSIIPSTGVTIYFKGVAGTAGSATGLVSGGAAGDFLCVVGTDSTTYMAIGAGYGTWTNN